MTAGPGGSSVLENFVGKGGNLFKLSKP